jgi:endonuclease/exonuclease/phosphatase family metal-dependent hydrolase
VRRRLVRPPALVVLAALAVLAACATTPGAPAAATLRVVTYNIFAGNDLERRSNLTRVAALIDSLGADVVLLQEVDRRTARSGDVDQASVLADLAGMRFVFGRAMDYDGGEYGIAVLTRWPVVASRVVPLEAVLPDELAARGAEPRALLHVVVRAPGGDVHVLNTHVDHRAHAFARHPQLFTLLAYVADSVPRGVPVVFGGDLNAPPDAAEVRALGLAFDDAWTACGTGDGHTFRSDRPTRRIDYVLLARASCTSAEVIDTTLSDHRPVVVDVVIGRRRAPR